MGPKKGRKLSVVVMEELQERSNRGLEFAKKTMLAERIEYEKLRKALEHYVKNWNDFTHPGLFSLACEAVGGRPDNAVQVQAAIALLAAAFDIHDDIIDGSEQKHAVPTVFGKYGKDIALLLGNAFLIKGFALFCVSTEALAQKDARKVIEALQASLFELGNAHAMELNLKGRIDAEPAEYMRVVEMKASGIEADMWIGAKVGGGADKEVEALTKYGRNLGTLATLREEFVDVFEVEELNQRIRGGYLPIPILYAMQNEETKERLNKLIAKGKATRSDTDDIVGTVFDDKEVIKLRKVMADLVNESVHLTSSIRNRKLRTQLANLASSTIEDL
ncbi:MAG: polyprenyl synthetase family protein [Candidatus Bathyarchaeia archaeon]|jgi:geranylgeranyl pyrophosphate synthase